MLASQPRGIIFTNLVDLDMTYGHRENPEGYATGLGVIDQYLPRLLASLTERDLLVMTADHGNDPTDGDTDHTREYVPLLVYEPGKKSRNLGLREGFYDVAQSVADYYDLSPLPRGKTLL